MAATTFISEKALSPSPSYFFQCFLMGQITPSRFQMCALCFRHAFAGGAAELVIASVKLVQSNCGAHAEFHC